MIAHNPHFSADDNRKLPVLPWYAIGNFDLAPWLPVAGAATPQVHLVKNLDHQYLAFEVSGLDCRDLVAIQQSLSDLSESRVRMAVVVTDDRFGDRLALVSGAFEINAGRLQFIPKSPFQPGASYALVLSFHTDSVVNLDDRSIHLSFEIPPQPIRRPKIRRIYPTVDEVPENLLRFYVHFDTPMSRGAAHQYVELKDDEENVLTNALLAPEQERWDREGRRLTLMLPPGRNTHGMSLHGDPGPILTHGKSYRLKIKPGWRDAAGNPLSVGFEKQFVAGPSVHDSISLSGWELFLPEAGTLDPFVIRFSRVMDHALLGRAVLILDRNGRRLAGRTVIEHGEQVWDFRPHRPWGNGKYFLAIYDDLEDPAGNRIAQSFEFDKNRFPSHCDGDKRYQIQFTLSAPHPRIE